MGEPLDNYTNVVDAAKAMMDRRRWNLAHGRVTISTVGLISQIRKLTKELPEVSLALSLHAPNQKARTAIVPTATRYPVNQLIEVLDEHMMAYLQQRKRKQLQTQTQTQGSGSIYTEEERIKESTRRRAMIEYVMCTYFLALFFNGYDYFKRGTIPLLVLIPLWVFYPTFFCLFFCHSDAFLFLFVCFYHPFSFVSFCALC